MKKNNVIYPVERKKQILDILKISDSVTVQELVDAFGVTGATVRTDLRELEAAKQLIRTHGGAVSITKSAYEEKPERRTNDHLKIRIAKKAVEYINDGDSIILDTGTTTLALAKQIASSPLKDLKIVTNDFNIAGILEYADNGEIYLAGGNIRKEYHCAVGYQVAKFFQMFSVDKAFLGASTFSLTAGFATPNMETSELKQVAMSIAKQSFILCDSLKFGKKSFFCFAGIDNIDYLITNDDINAEHLKELEKHEAQIVLT